MNGYIGEAEDAEDLAGVVDHAVLDGEVAEESAGVVVGEDAEMGELAEVGAGGGVGGKGELEEGGDGGVGAGIYLIVGDMGDVHRFFLLFGDKNKGIKV